jgi:hypothetical protein
MIFFKPSDRWPQRFLRGVGPWRAGSVARPTPDSRVAGEATNHRLKLLNRDSAWSESVPSYLFVLAGRIWPKSRGKGTSGGVDDVGPIVVEMEEGRTRRQAATQ